MTRMVLQGCLAQRVGVALEFDSATGALKSEVPEEFVAARARAGYVL